MKICSKPLGVSLTVKIGVFDSGIGGMSVAHAIAEAFPDVDVIFEDDHENLPYGIKSPDELRRLAIPHLNSLKEKGCTIIVVACNTLSTTIIPDLKNDFPVPLVPIVPMIKPASLATKTKKVAVCATPTTLASERYAELKREYGEGIEFIEPYCGDWAEMIESNDVDQLNIQRVINDVCAHGADVIVLGCTHYHWIETEIKELADGRAVVIQPEQAVIQNLASMLGRTL